MCASICAKHTRLQEIEWHFLAAFCEGGLKRLQKPKRLDAVEMEMVLQGRCT